MSYGETAIYVSPQGITEEPDYLRRLVYDYGVTSVFIRTGFDINTYPTELGEAVRYSNSVGAKVYLLTGAWWGEGLNPPADCTMSSFAHFNVKNVVAHESQWEMYAPGSSYDQALLNQIGRWIQEFDPKGVCLTHARYRHPAHIPGLFEVGDGWFKEQLEINSISIDRLSKALADSLKNLGKVSIPRLHDLARCGIPELFDHLAGSNVFSRWFAFRCRVIEERLKYFADTVKSREDSIEFGVNVYTPLISSLAGQRYREVLEICDFIQPLLGYMEWHRYQPIAAWARFLASRVGDLDEKTAIEVACSLFGLELANLPDKIDQFYDGEGPPENIFATVRQELSLCKELVPEKSSHVFPILRGYEWPPNVIGEIRSDILQVFGGQVFQGTDFLTGEQKGAYWK